MWTIALCFFRSKPEENELEVERITVNEEENVELLREEEQEVHWELGEVLKTPHFWVLALCGLERGAVETALVFYIRDIGAVSGITQL